MTRAMPELRPGCSFPMPVLLILPCFSRPSMKTTPEKLSYGGGLCPIKNHDMWWRRIENAGDVVLLMEWKRMAAFERWFGLRLRNL